MVGGIDHAPPRGRRHDHHHQQTTYHQVHRVPYFVSFLVWFMRERESITALVTALTDMTQRRCNILDSIATTLGLSNIVGHYRGEVTFMNLGPSVRVHLSVQSLTVEVSLVPQRFSLPEEHLCSWFFHWESFLCFSTHFFLRSAFFKTWLGIWNQNHIWPALT